MSEDIGTQEVKAAFLPVTSRTELPRIDVPPPQGIALRTNRLLLRALRATDQGAFLAAAHASRAELNETLPLHLDGESDEVMFQRQLRLAAPAAGHLHISAPYVRLVAIMPDGRVAGGFNINAITRGLEYKADVNWWVATPLTGAGLATEGLAALLRHAMADLPGGLGLQTVHAWITRGNAASIRVAQKAGFLRAGEEKSYVSTGGRWLLHDLYICRVDGLTDER